MTKQKTHTPGPLHAIEYQDGLWMVGNDADGEQVSTAHGIKNKADADLYSAAPELKKSVELIMTFLDSLPKGWLGKTTGDIAALNDFYLTAQPAYFKAIGGKPCKQN